MERQLFSSVPQPLESEQWVLPFLSLALGPLAVRRMGQASSLQPRRCRLPLQTC